MKIFTKQEVTCKFKMDVTGIALTVSFPMPEEPLDQEELEIV